jgi:hypothetical protein
MNKDEACKILNIVLLNEVTLKQKYRLALLKFHPDKGGDNDSFRKVLDAYKFLKEYIETNETKNDNIEYYIQLIKRFNYSMVDTFIVEPLVNYLKKVTYDLNPTITQLINKNVYYLSEYDIYIPLWHHEIIFKNVIININPALPENILIDNDNNIHVIITNDQMETFIIGGVSFLISDCIKNMNLLKGKGIPKINIKNIYDYSELSDIILHFKP